MRRLIRPAKVSMIGIGLGTGAFLWLVMGGGRPARMAADLQSVQPTLMDVATTIVDSSLVEQRTPSAVVLDDATTPPIAPESKGPLEETRDELAAQVDDSVEGYLDINPLLDRMLEFARLPVEAKADLDDEDDDTISYKMLETPAGTTARFMVGRVPFEQDGKDCRQVQLEVKMGGEQAGFYRDCYRYGPRAEVAISYDEAHQPVALALILERKIALRESREKGVDAFRDRWTSGAGYKVEFARKESPFSETFGLVDGNYAHGDKFQGISPLRGNTLVDEARVKALLNELLAKRSRVSSGG